MSGASDHTIQIQLRLDRMRAGDDRARDELLCLACDRLARLASKMLRGYAGVARWEQTDDLLQNATIRLCRALGDVIPESTRSFFNLAAVQIRRELIDLSRHYYGPEGVGANHESVGQPDTQIGPAFDSPASDTDEPSRLAEWTEFHEMVEALPDVEKEVFNLLWYQGLTQSEAAMLLKVTERIVKWRWRSARLKLHGALGGRMPGS